MEPDALTCCWSAPTDEPLLWPALTRALKLRGVKWLWKRLHQVGFRDAATRIEQAWWMVIRMVPVIPPELRYLFPWTVAVFATST